MKRKTINEVRDIFKSNNCQLLETTYINNRTPMRYKCYCGRIDYIRLDNFQKGSRCGECGREKTKKSNSLSLEEVRKVFSVNNCTLLESEYQNAHTLMEYRCSCGNIARITLSNFKAGCRCAECKSVKIKERLQYSQEEVMTILKQNNLEILSEYDGYHSNITYKCLKCTYIGKRSLSSIICALYPCKNCYIENITGENSIHWKNDLTQEFRENGRATNEDYEWKRIVKERDNFTCQCCNRRGVEIHAHHINNYADFPEHRYEISNGITLCKECHIQFHKNYGKKMNNIVQLEEFISKFII